MDRRKVTEDPIAVIGMAFRFPGDLSDEQSFWGALKEGKDLVTRVGAERWATNELEHPRRAEPGRSITFSAGVLSRIDEFDAGFFGISPREAAWLDPQQRLLLELAWEAMENAGQVPSSLAGSDTAVYVGISGMDYGLGALNDLASMTAHSMTGNTLSVAANRLSYVFDFRGPSLAVDTACSSSLVALHHACQCLHSGEASSALVGGVSLLLHPYPFVGFTKASMLSANGRCRAFDAAGDGYVRAEGGAVLLLKPLSRALADGDHVQAVILGTGVNADGSRKTGMTIPSSEGQADLMAAVLRQSGILPQDVDYVEAHGTGTPVGDPIEAAAIGKVYGCRGVRRAPLPIGSVKTNLGHLEPASGMAGLVKAMLALKNRGVPPSLHFDEPNPNIDFGELNLEVVTKFRPVAAANDKPMVVGVNSFGFGGANAHVLVQEYRAEESRRADEPRAAPLFLSARTAQALRATAGRYGELLERDTEVGLYEVAYATAYRRQRFEKRLALKAQNSKEAAALLAQYAQGESVTQVVVEDALDAPGGVAFVYSGNGAQWVGMGRRLLGESPRFAAIMADLDARLQRTAGFSLLQELNADESAARLDDTTVAQPLLFAIQVALTTMLREQGIEPDAVTGHSVGEVAAAWAAGAIDLDQAVDVICARSFAQGQTRGLGRMAAVGLGESAMRELLASGHYGDVEVAGINSQNNVTIAGGLDDLERLQRVCEPQGIFFRVLDLDYAFHSRHMDAIQGALAERLAHHTVRQRNAVTYVSTVTGGVLRSAALDADYWWQNVRQPVRFAAAVSTLIAQGCRIFVEIGPHAILQRYLNECLAAESVRGRVLDTLRRNDDGLSRLDEATLRVHMLREPVKLEAYFPERGRHVQLPSYAWQRERYSRPVTSEGYGLSERRRVHPLLGWPLKELDAAWENVLDTSVLPWLRDHQVGGAVVLPGAAYVEMALAIAQERFGGASFELEELEILAPVVFDAEHARTLRIEFFPRNGSFRIRSRQRLSDDEWTLNAVGRLLGVPASGAGAVRPRAEPVEQDSIVDGKTHYRLAAAIGLEYGPAFQGLETARVCGATLHGTLAAGPLHDGDDQVYFLPPALLDVCFQSLVDFFKDDIEAGRGVPLLPVKVGGLRYFRKAPVVGFRTRLLRRGARSVTADFELLDAAGGVVATLSNCRFRAAALQRYAHAAPACWQIVPRLLPHPREQMGVQFPQPSELAQQAHSWLAHEEARLDRTGYFNEALPLLDALAVSFAHEAFRELFDARPDWLQRMLDAPAEGRLDGVPLSFARWLAGCLRREGLLVKEEGDTWRLNASDMPPAAAIWKTVMRDFPACLPELVIAGRIGRNLCALLAGEVGIASFLESLKNSHPSETLYDEAPAYLGDRLAIQHILGNLAASIPANRRLRILEVSSGASELPRQMAGLLADERLEYVLAVADPDVRDRLSAELHHHPYVAVVGLANDRLELVSDTPVPEMYDVIVCRHWLHLAQDPRATLMAARSKLASGGLLILAERHADLAADFAHGIDPLWWRVGGATEPESCLQPAATWANELARQGFENVEVIVEPANAKASVGSYVLLANRPQEQAALMAPGVATWLLLSDGHGPSRELAAQLQQQLELSGQRVAMALANGGDSDTHSVYDLHAPEAVARVLRAAQSQLGEISHVVHLAGWESSTTGANRGVFPESEASVGLLHLVHGLTETAGWPKLWLVTSGGAMASHNKDRKSDPAQASLWGFGRVIMNEYPALECTLIDVASADAPDTAERLGAELLSPDGESEVVLAAEGRYGLRMERAELGDRVGDEASAARYRLDFHVPGQLRNLAWLPNPERALADDEIEVRVMAAGLNFRDVMYTMGLLPDEAVENGFAGASIGLEFAGVVARAGNGVRDLAVGDAVMGFGSACFASHVVTKATALVRKPDEWSFEEAATVPTVFFTVYYALKHLANLQPGERVLIHGAAGGVGIAAIQLASHLGAEVFATAGSDEKRDFVRLLGADHVFDSRSLDFASQILDVTQGDGVDVVVNSLAGEAIRRNLQVLKPFGRFLELGKRDFFENTPIGLRPFKDNISYFGIDADQLLVARPALAARLFREVMALFRDDVFSPLPYRSFPAKRVVDAFRTMQQARHIGKVVVTLGEAEVEVERSDAAPLKVEFDRGATYLVTGGLAGFGLESARWLAQHGAGNLVLVGRRGIQTPGAAEAVRGLEAMGVNVRAVACDVANREALQALIADTRRTMPPLKGVLHAAMVLDDALIANLDAERWRKVLAPKLLGAKHLHELTLDIPLDCFVLYSSVTTFIGNPGQANYVAANGYLEGLAQLRRSLGLPVTCVGWGPISDAGYLTRNEAVKDSLKARLGAAPLTTEKALIMLERMLATGADTMAIADFDWHTMAKLLPSATTSRFARLRREAGSGVGGDEHGDFATLILGKSPEEVAVLVQALVTQEVAKILGIGADRIDPARSLIDLGMDSLMGVELALGLEDRFGIRLPAMMLNEGPTVERVSARILEKVMGGDPIEDGRDEGELHAYLAAAAIQHGEAPADEEVAELIAAVHEDLKTGTRLAK